MYRAGFLNEANARLQESRRNSSLGITRVFEGEIKDGWPAGAGTLSFENGFRAGGTWSGYSLTDGPGWVEFPNGERFESSWRSESDRVWHKRAGAASICIQNDCRNGPGVELDQNFESFYVGEFRDGRFSGRGALFWKYRLLPATADTAEPVAVSEPDFYIYAGDFLGGELSSGTLFCLRHLRFCRYLVSVHQRRRKPGARLRAEWVNNYGFFKDRTRPLLPEFQEAARYLSAAGAN